MNFHRTEEMLWRKVRKLMAARLFNVEAAGNDTFNDFGCRGNQMNHT